MGNPIESTDAAVCVFSHDLHVVHANAQWLRWVGCVEADVQGAEAAAVFAETSQLALSLLERAREGETIEVPRHVERINGRRAWWEGTLSPVALEGSSGVLVTARKFGQLTGPTPGPATSAAREWLEALPAIAWSTDEHASIVDRNRRWFEYTGRPPEEASGSDWLEVIHPEDVPRAAAAVQRAVASGGMLDEEFRVRRHDGVYRWFVGRASPVRDGEGRVTGWMGIAIDIEDRKQAEQALREADRRKNEFLGVLSHELRNPLAPIASSTYILEHTDPSGAQARRACAVIARQTAHMGRLLDDLLDVTRIVRGKIELKRAPLDLVEVVRRAAEDRRVLLEDRGIALVLDLPAEPCHVDGDPVRLAQVMGNLLDNAAKFTHRGGRVRVSIREQAGTLVLRVEDDGVGITPEVLPTIFEPFAQGPQGLARTAGGLGLGLALVRGLVEMHGGAAWARSDGAGRGTEVVVTLPALALPATRSPEERGVQGVTGGRRLNVLVVDDHPDTAESLAQVVALCGHEARVAHDARSALAQALADPPDAVLCDIGLPGQSGYDVARALRASRHGSDLLLVAVSGYALPEDIRAAHDAGFDHHLPKPPDLGALRSLLGTNGSATVH